MSPAEALRYGLIDEVLAKRKEVDEDKDKGNG